MNLSLRLNKVKDTVKPCVTACDIGCDHGYVSMALIEEKRAEHVIACDVNPGPLEAARRNISEAHLEDAIELRLSDGFKKIETEDHPDACIIAGMGGRLMERILTEGSEVLAGVSQLVLQPQSELFLVRKWLRDNGFKIVSESALRDEGKYYFIIDARPGTGEKAADKELQDIYDEFSYFLINKGDNTLKDYLNMLYENNLGYLENIHGEKRETLLKRNELIKRVLKMTENPESGK